MGKQTFLMRWVGLALLFSLISSFFPGRAPVSARAQTAAPDVALYTIEVELDVETHRLEGRQTILYRNTGSQPMPDLIFHLYLNAFENEDTLFMRESGGSHRGFSFTEDANGWIEVTRLAVKGGSILELELLEDGTLARAELPEAVSAGEAVELEMVFHAQLPQVFARTGWATDAQGDPFFMVGQWFPKLGVWTDEGWNAYPFHNNAEFFADFGTYDVTITLPDHYIIGATGMPVSQRRGAGKQTAVYHAEDVIDFAWTASPNFETASVRVPVPGGEETELLYLYLPEHAWTVEPALRGAEKTITYLSNWYGPYPYPRLTLVDVPDEGSGAGGMEYPTLVTLGAFFGDEDQLEPGWDNGIELVTVHEVAHQWWQSMAAFNEAEEPWLDEGFTDYSTSRVMIAEYGLDFETSETSLGAPYLDRRRATFLRNPDLPMAGNAWEFNLNDYVIAAYAKPNVALLTLERVLGEDTMLEILRTFFTRYQFRHPTVEDFRAVAEEVAGKEAVEWFFDGLVYGDDLVNFTIRSADDRSVTVERVGELEVPTTVEVTFADGKTQTVDWPAKQDRQTYRFSSGAPVQSVQIDPDRTLFIELDWRDNDLVRDVTEPVPTRTPDPTDEPRPEVPDVVPIFQQNGLAPDVAVYEIDVTLDPEMRRLEGRQKLRYVNVIGRPMPDIVFHLYLNAFESEETVFMQESGAQHRGFDFNPTQNGWIDVNDIRLADGTPLTLELLDDGTLARTELPEPVLPGDTVELELDFSAQLPQVFARSGWALDEQGDLFFMVGQWFPKPGVWTDEGWNAHPYHANAEFFADFGAYEVRITLPEGWVTGATGQPGEVILNEDGTQTAVYQAEDVIDFAWTASPNLQAASRRVPIPAGSGQPAGEIELVYLYLPEHAWSVERALDAAEAAVTRFSTWFGPYPYPRLTVVDVPDEGQGAGGMEYPTLVTAGTFDISGLGLTGAVLQRMRLLEMVIVHEIGHQWWQSMVAFNETEEPWLDEGLTDYAAMRAMGDAYGETTSLIEQGGLRIGYLDLRRMEYIANPQVPMYGPSWEFGGMEYGVAAYSKPVLSLLTLENTLSEPVMLEIMSTFFERHQFSHPSTEDFRTAVDEVAGAKSPDWFFDGLVFNDVTLNYRAAAVAEHSFTVERQGDLAIPTEIEVIFSGGLTRRVAWDGRVEGETGLRSFTFPDDPPVHAFTIDPERKILIDLVWSDNGLRRRADLAAWLTLFSRLVYRIQDWLLVLGGI